MMRVMAKKPDRTSPLIWRAAMLAGAGCVHMNVPAQTSAPASMANGVRPEIEGNRLKRKMLLRHATSPGSMDAATV